jgi:hypothetical protein
LLRLGAILFPDSIETAVKTKGKNMKNTQYLFLGGAADGQWLTVFPGTPEVRVVTQVTEHKGCFYGLAPNVHFHQYRLIRFREGDGAKYAVYAYDDDPMEPIARLIAGYVSCKSNPLLTELSKAIENYCSDRPTSAHLKKP